MQLKCRKILVLGARKDIEKYTKSPRSWKACCLPLALNYLQEKRDNDPTRLLQRFGNYVHVFPNERPRKTLFFFSKPNQMFPPLDVEGVKKILEFGDYIHCPEENGEKKERKKWKRSRHFWNKLTNTLEVITGEESRAKNAN